MQPITVKLGLALPILGLLATGCGAEQAESSHAAAEVETPEVADGSTMDEIIDRGTIRIGTKYDLPGVGAQNLSGEPVGFDIEVGELIAENLGISPDSIEWVETVSANREPYVQQERVDLVIAYYAITPAREEVVTFAGPYLEGGHDLLVADGNPKDITGPDSAAGSSICGQAGSTGPLYLRDNHPDIDIVEFDTMSKCVDALKQGQVDGVVQADHVLAGASSQDPGEFELVGNLFEPLSFGIGMPKDNVDMCEFVNQVLSDSMSDGKFDEMWLQTVGEAMEEDEAPPHPELQEC